MIACPSTGTARPRLRSNWFRPKLTGRLLALLVAATTWAQGNNPYGRIEPVELSVSVLQQSVGGLGNPGPLERLIKFDPPSLDLLLEGLLDHQAPTMRVVAGRALIDRGADPIRIMKRVGTNPIRSALVVSLFGDGQMDSELATALLATDPSLSPSARAILLASVPDPDRLAPLLSDDAAPEVASGIAAISLEESRPGAVAAWLDGLTERKNRSKSEQDRILFEVLAIASKLGLVDALTVIATMCEERSEDDALRASAVLSQLELDPERGVPAWKRLAAATPAPRMIPTALLLVIAEVPAPDTLADQLASNDPLPAAVRTMILAPPEDRLEAARAVVALGHVPTIRWILNQDADSIPRPLAERILDRVISRQSSNMMETGIVVATSLGRTNPEELAERLRVAIENKDLTQAAMLLEALIRVRTPEAAAVATEFLQLPQRNLRSLALLAVANGGELEGTSIRRLGRAAAGGGGLPESLRPLAAWHYLRLQDRLGESMPAILDS
ncbi:MAG: hypothetical protein CMJ23_05850 [Phycisphaerae bacterium]|nr:hypothetical protein [Phycisphaerae bacterium]